MRQLPRLLLLAGLMAACAEPAGKTADVGGVRLAWPGLPESLRRGEFALHTNEPLTMEIDFFNVDFEWSEGGNVKSARYLVPAVISRTEDKTARVKLLYDGAEPESPVAPEFTLQIPGVPVMSGAKLHVEGFALGKSDEPIMAGEIKDVEVTPEGTHDYQVKLEFTKAIDADDDGFLPAEIGGGDCDETDAETYAGAVEACDGRDTACNGRTDELNQCAWAGAPGGTPMQLVPAGVGYVGWSSLAETPRKKIYHAAFYIDRYEVSLAKYAECLTCAAPASTIVAGLTSYDKTTYADFPVVHVDWWQAFSYCATLGKRLPTEFEWEVAARGFGDIERAVPWQEGSSFSTQDEFANVLGRLAEGPNQVAALADGMSPFGVYNMMGNAAEWTSSWYDAQRYEGIDEQLLAVAPPEPSSGTAKVHKGGGWDTRQSDAYPFRRVGAVTDSTAPGLGFRCAMSAP